jgi:hypothetical protein
VAVQVYIQSSLAVSLREDVASVALAGENILDVFVSSVPMDGQTNAWICHPEWFFFCDG